VDIALLVVWLGAGMTAIPGMRPLV